MPIIVSALSEDHAKKIMLAIRATENPGAPFSSSEEISEAKVFGANIRKFLYEIKWFQGVNPDKVEIGESGDCLVAWHNGYPMLVNLEPFIDLMPGDEGEIEKAHIYTYVTYGAAVGSSSSIGAAMQSAALYAIEMNGRPNISGWAGLGEKAFFQTFKVNTQTDKELTFADFAGPPPIQPDQNISVATNFRAV